MEFNKDELFSNLISVLREISVVEHIYIDDTVEPNVEHKYSSIYGAYNKEMLETIVRCLFKDGIENFKPIARDFIERNGVAKFKTELVFFAGSLQSTIQDIKPVFSEEIIMKSKLKAISTSNDDEKLFENSLKKGLSKEIMIDILREEISNQIEVFKNSEEIFLIDYVNKISEPIEFKVDEEFFSKYGEKIYLEFKAEGVLLDYPDFKQFLDFCYGRVPTKKLKFNKNASLITFYNYLNSKGKIVISKKYLKFFASSCTNLKDSLTSKSLNSNRAKNINKTVENILKKFLP